MSEFILSGNIQLKRIYELALKDWLTANTEFKIAIDKAGEEAASYITISELSKLIFLNAASQEGNYIIKDLSKIIFLSGSKQVIETNEELVIPIGYEYNVVNLVINGDLDLDGDLNIID